VFLEVTRDYDTRGAIINVFDAIITEITVKYIALIGAAAY
jgi:hypothetical protein